LAAGGALAQAVDEDATADLGPLLHVGEHPCASLPVPRMVGRSASIVGMGQRVRPRALPVSAARRLTPPGVALLRRRSDLSPEDDELLWKSIKEMSTLIARDELSADEVSLVLDLWYGVQNPYWFKIFKIVQKTGDKIKNNNPTRLTS